MARTFSKICGMAGMRLGYAIAPRELIQRMAPHGTGSINAVVKWGAVAALQDTESASRPKRETIRLRNRTTRALEDMGYSVIPSETNFFMVHLRRPVQPIIEEFRKRNVLVGRPFPPLTDYLRVSIGHGSGNGPLHGRLARDLPHDERGHRLAQPALARGSARAGRNVALDSSKIFDMLAAMAVREQIELEAAAKWFHALADATRWQIVVELAEGERCVCELVDELGVAQSRLSFHLRILKEAGVVRDRRAGRWVYYALEPGVLERMGEVLGAVAAGRWRGRGLPIVRSSCC